MNPQNKPIIVQEDAGKKYYCRCSLSANQPYCDGSHKTTDFLPIIVEMTEARRVAYCGCRQSGEIPFCDGTHNSL